MKKQKPPFPIYDVSEFQRSPTCDRGIDCSPAENPAHHVLIDLTSEARGVIEHLIFSLRETHEEHMILEYNQSLGLCGSRALKNHRKDEPKCSYCVAIRDGNALLKFAKED